MKTILIFIILCIFSTNLVFTQNNDSTPIEEDEFVTTAKQIGDSVKVAFDNVVDIGTQIHKEYKKRGPKEFVRIYKYYILTILIFVFLTLLWFRNRTN